MGEKFVPVEMPQGDESIYIAYFKDKIHIAFHGTLSDERITEIKNMFSGAIITGEKSTGCDKISATIHIMHNFKNSCIIAAKSAINTLAYLKGAEYITQTLEFDNIINQVMSGSDEIFNSVKGIEFDEVEKMRQKLYVCNEQQVCILRTDMKQLKAWVFFYGHGFEVLLCDYLKSSCIEITDGIICDWKNRKDYRYLDYLTNMGVLSKS